MNFTPQEQVPRLSAQQKEALDLLDEVLDREQFVLKFDMRPGDIIFASNHSLVHGRTAFQDEEPAADSSGKSGYPRWTTAWSDASFRRARPAVGRGQIPQAVRRHPQRHRRPPVQLPTPCPPRRAELL